ncbi:glycosyltransferase [Marinobacter sp.]|uniref:glycosyltransferase n=1 Tax=Marinobacter sp. TaxID=50741 RepID=UPI0034A0FF05
MKKIRVVHLVAGDLRGGAARGAYWLHRGLLKHGIDSHIITNHHDNLGDPTVKSLSVSKLRRFVSKLMSSLDLVLLLIFPKRERRIFSTGFFGLNYKREQVFREAEVVHLHWVNGLVATRSLKNIDKPVVMSIRDMWPMTGGCHYALDCKKYETGCGGCPQLNSGFGWDFSKLIAQSKQKYFSDIKPVGISEWIAEQANKSFVFRGNKAGYINNNVDCSLFYPMKKDIARKILGVCTEKKVILAGSTNVKDFYKGFHLFLESLRYLDKHSIFLCVFGKPDISLLEGTGFEFKAFGYLNDDISMRLAYNAADVFVAPSVQEAFGKTLVESLACGTPVVSFDATGPKGIIEHKVDGYKAAPFDPEDMAVGVDWVLNKSDYESLSHAAAKSASTKFDSVVIARQYIDLYSDLVSEDLE